MLCEDVVVVVSANIGFWKTRLEMQIAVAIIRRINGVPARQIRSLSQIPLLIEQQKAALEF